MSQNSVIIKHLYKAQTAQGDWCPKKNQVFLNINYFESKNAPRKKTPRSFGQS